MADKSTKNKTGLGRGLSALLGESTNQQPNENYQVLRLAQVEPNPNQPRKHFDDEGLQDLADSIRQHGIIVPIMVRLKATGQYEIVAGERRWRAARMAGLTQVPVCILEANDQKAAEISLIENLQREDLQVLEVAEGYRSLIEVFGLTQEDLATRVGRSRSAVTTAMRLLGLPNEVKVSLSEGKLTEGHARAILALQGEKKQIAAGKYVVDHKLTVRQTEAYVRKVQEGMEQKPEVKAPAVNYLRDYEMQLSEKFQRGVKILPGKKKGKLLLEFYNPKDLDILMEHLLLKPKENTPLT
jgi:ParB family chromosome partitioning protein